MISYLALVRFLFFFRKCVRNGTEKKHMADLRDMVDGRLHAAQLGGLDVQQLQDVVGQSVDLIRHAGQ